MSLERSTHEQFFSHIYQDEYKATGAYTMATSTHDDSDTSVAHAAPVAEPHYIENGIMFNWRRSSKVGSVTGAGLGAAAGAALGAAGLFIGAILGVIVGSLIGMVAGLAAGGAADAVAESFKSGV